jgi:nitrite reductase/ring-hydroxylating ferredoxin subunit
MTDQQQPIASMGRRNFLVRAIVALHGAMLAALAFVLGGAILSPSFRRREESWLRAASLGALRDNEPVAVTLRVSRQDGYAQVVDRTVVYLVKVGERDVRALSSTCTHLGCRTSYDRVTRHIVCPCHGGVFDVQGNVIEGPPSEPLAPLATRIDGGNVLVQV